MTDINIGDLVYVNPNFCPSDWSTDYSEYLRKHSESGVPATVIALCNYSSDILVSFNDEIMVNKGHDGNGINQKDYTTSDLPKYRNLGYKERTRWYVSGSGIYEVVHLKPKKCRNF